MLNVRIFRSLFAEISIDENIKAYNIEELSLLNEIIEQ